jgi:two-component system cell cycle response regulator DivK
VLRRSGPAPSRQGQTGAAPFLPEPVAHSLQITALEDRAAVVSSVLMPNLLIIHAGTDDRQMYAEYLRAHRFDVIEAPTTDAALTLVPTADVVITGLLVPGSIDPIELIHRIRSEQRHKPIIVVTARIEPEIHQRAHRAGCDVLLLKPCLPDVLLQTVRDVLKAIPASPP